MFKIQQIGDKAAVGISLLCMVHCLFSPILLILIPSLSGVFAFNDELFHLWLVYAVVPVSSIAMLIGYLHHRSQRVFLIGARGLIMLILTAFWGHELLGKFAEMAFTVLGSSIIAYSHIRNYQQRSLNKRPEPHH